MSCGPARPCGEPDALLTPETPAPGRSWPARSIGDFHTFLAALIRDLEQVRPDPDAALLGRTWDVEGDPAAVRLARLWAFVAHGVAAYSDLTAAESYLGTALDWTDLRRIAALVGFRPRPRVAARGWAVVRTDRGASPSVPAGTRVQAPATPDRAAQTFEVETTTTLRADWANLTATPVPLPSIPDGRTLRFLTDPGFRPGDQVLFVAEQDVPLLPSGHGWFGYWSWLLDLYDLGEQFAPKNAPVAVAVVQARSEDLGTVEVTFDRDLDQLLKEEATSYAAYRVLATAGSARRLTQLVHLTTSGTTTQAGVVAVGSSLYGSGDTGPIGSNYVVLDAALDELSAQRLVAVVDWQAGVSGACDVAAVARHKPVDWPVAPGTTARASRVEFAADVETLRAARDGGRPVTVYVVDRRIVARTHEIPTSLAQGVAPQIRVFPAPAAPPDRIALRLGPAETDWQLFPCAAAAGQEDTGDAGTPAGLILDLAAPAPEPGGPLDGPLGGPLGRAAASANLVPVRHGMTGSGVLGSGDAVLAGQEMVVNKPPVARDVGADGSPVSSLEIRVGGVLWEERPSLYDAGPVDAYTTRLDADGTERVRFGDGAQGNRLPTGRGNVTQTHRTGGGTAGEVPSGAVDTLLGSIAGVVGVRGAGPTSGGADQDDERRIRRLAPGRARAFGRAVSRSDLADLALGFPGVSHARAWRGSGPPGCGCGGSGEHVAFLRLTSAVTGGRPRPPVADEIGALAAFLDGSRDPAIPLCVAAAVFTEPALSCTVAVDPRQAAGAVQEAVRTALTASGGILDPLERTLGQPIDRSDLFAVIHRVAGVLGVPSLTLDVGLTGRIAAARYQLLAPATGVTVTTEQA
ncbi:hypothetical protein [Actinomadura sp. 6N118]|uniref:hypothetical protein n=1 Tax=Actinomadura sp. 6N118 TaxID=3375151 RepID=UPI0037BA1D4F